MLADLDEDLEDGREVRSALAARLRYWRLAMASIVALWRGRRPVSEGSAWRAALVQDARYSLRTMRRQPGFASITILTLALGIGANTAIFSVLNGVLLRPLPYAEPSSLVNVWQVSRDWQRSDIAAFRARADRFPASWPVYREWTDRSRSLVRLAAYTDGARLVERADTADWVRTSETTASLLAVLGIEPAIGRWFAPEEDQRGAPNLAVLSHGFAERWLGAPESALGATIRLNGTPFEVIGVMPAGFYFPTRGHELWIRLNDDRRNDRWTSQSMAVVARLAEDVPLEVAASEMRGIADAIMDDYPEAIDAGVRVVSRVDEVTGETGSTLWFLMAAVGLVLLVATTNVAGLLLVRVTARRRELRMRVALGARQSRLFVQMLTEGAMLALAGGAVGVIVLVAMFGWIRSLLPPATPRIEDIVLSWPVFAFAGSVSLLVAIVFGLTSAVYTFRQAIDPGPLGDSVRLTGRQYGRSVLVVGEVAVSVVLLTAAALLVQSYVRLTGVDSGFDARGVLTTTVTAPRSDWGDADRLRAFFSATVARARALPGVLEAGLVSDLPFGGGQSASSFGLAPDDEDEAGWSLEQRATAGYFDAMGITLLRGRLFGADDTPAGPNALVVNERFVQSYYADRDPVGETIWEAGVPYVIVGVVSAVKHGSLGEEIERKRYRFFGQTPGVQMTLVIRTTGDPSALASVLRDRVRDVEPLAVVSGTATMQGLLARATALPRFRTLMIGALALIACVLTASGVYGVLAFTVASRTREIGVRMSLGARRIDVLRHVLLGGLRLIVPGAALGVAAAYGASRSLELYMFQTVPGDPITLLGVVAAVVVLALLATVVPARRASRVDPLVALRSE